MKSQYITCDQCGEILKGSNKNGWIGKRRTIGIRGTITVFIDSKRYTHVDERPNLSEGEAAKIEREFCNIKCLDLKIKDWMKRYKDKTNIE